MAATLVVAFVVIAISTAGGGAMARSDPHIRNELAQQINDDNGGGEAGVGGEGSGGGYPSSGVGDGTGYEPSPPSSGGVDGSNQGPGYEPSPPADSGDSGSAPTDGSSGSAPTDGSIPLPTVPGKGIGSGAGKPDHMPHIPQVPIYGSTPIGHMPHIPKVPIKGTGHGSCAFWSSNFGSWPNIMSSMPTIASIFGNPASSMFPGSMTLLQALQNNNNDAYSSLLKQASASMLNAFAYKNFQFSPDDVKTKFGAALKSPDAAAAQASQFARANLALK